VALLAGNAVMENKHKLKIERPEVTMNFPRVTLDFTHLTVDISKILKNNLLFCR
jgi:hypothetical protein